MKKELGNQIETRRKELGVSTYDLIKANTKESIACAKMQNIYMQRDSASGTAYFRFTVI